MPPVQLPARRALFGALLAAAIVLATGAPTTTRSARTSPSSGSRSTSTRSPRRTLRALGRVELVARNIGRLTHNLQIEIPPRTPTQQTETLGETPTAQPGTTVDATVDLKPGTYRHALLAGQPRRPGR